MPRLIAIDDRAACGLAEAIQAIDAVGFDPRDEASLAHAALWLRRLGNHRAFLGDLLIEQLAASHKSDPVESGYGPQAIVLSGTRSGFFLRANIWPAEHDHAFRTSGARSFVYGVPHDHNFDFLTVGYFGPGYLSDYCEYDYEAVSGWRGEPAGLRFTERSALAPGRLLHYRAHRDVHRQLPPGLDPQAAHEDGQTLANRLADGNGGRGGAHGVTPECQGSTRRGADRRRRRSSGR